jgi:uncharacterized heparinase superfamily protein
VTNPGSGPDDAGKAVVTTPKAMTLRERWQAGFIYQLMLRGAAPSALDRLPPSAWPASAAHGRAIVAGEDPPATQLHDFGWLHDLAALGSPEAQARARDLLTNWCAAARRWQPSVWEPGPTARRLAACLAEARFWSQGADDLLTRTLLAALARHVRHLSRVFHHATPGFEAAQVAKALIYAGLCGFGEAAAQRGLRLLEEETGVQMLRDGGHIQRSPALHQCFLAVLIDIRDMLALTNQPAPAWLASAIDAMTPVLRLYCHGDGSLARFNGTGLEDPALTGEILRRAKVTAPPPMHAAQAGFIRLVSDRTVVIIDAGTPPPPPFDLNAHAGTLSFELSHNGEPVIVNCGARPDAARAWQQAQRATAAHSTLTFADTNSSEILPADLGRQPRHVPATCDSRDGEFWVTASHDGYRANFGLVHRRRLYLSADGRDLRGEDTLSGRHDGRFAIRFHLHPDIQASQVQNAAAVLLRASSGTAWRLQAASAALSLAETVYLAAPGAPRRSEQVILSGSREDSETVVKWALRRVDAD